MNPDPVQVTAWLKSWAYMLGFDIVGAARVDAVPLFSESAWHWIQAGFGADMTWIERTGPVRLQPMTRWPDLRSVLVLAMSYHSGVNPRVPGIHSLQVSNYAIPVDYHRTLGRKLRTLARWASRRYPQAWFRPYVDTGPFLERAWAARAGLGWIGRNAMIIHRRLGSWTFLGLLLTNLILDDSMDGPTSNLCGSCRACVDICPTGAIVADGVIDSRLCIAYWTVEFKGPLPATIRPMVGTHVFGCDDCQAVCPWNRHAQSAHTILSAAKTSFTERGFGRLLLMPHDELKRLLHHTPMQRLGPQRLRRNIVIAMGNSRNPAWLPFLEPCRGRTVYPLDEETLDWAIRQCCPQHHG